MLRLIDKKYYLLYDLNYKLKVAYHNAKKDNEFKDFVDSINLSDEKLMKYTSLLEDSFKEFKNKCKYTNCMHINEKECVVKELVNKNIILKSRYENYIKFIK